MSPLRGPRLTGMLVSCLVEGLRCAAGHTDLNAGWRPLDEAREVVFPDVAQAFVDLSGVHVPLQAHHLSCSAC